MQEIQEMCVQSLGWEDPLEEQMTTHPSILYLENPMDRGAHQATAHRVAKSPTWLSKWTHSHILGVVCQKYRRHFPSLSFYLLFRLLLLLLKTLYLTEDFLKLHIFSMVKHEHRLWNSAWVQTQATQIFLWTGPRLNLSQPWGSHLFLEAVLGIHQTKARSEHWHKWMELTKNHLRK